MKDTEPKPWILDPQKLCEIISVLSFQAAKFWGNLLYSKRLLIQCHQQAFYFLFTFSIKLSLCADIDGILETTGVDTPMSM